MLSFSEKFPGWKDFPKGLHVLVVDESPEVLSDVQKRLESFSYVVSSFSNGQDALDALHREENSFHVALLEATSGNGFDVFKILEATRHLPTVMMSNTENMAIMMKSIAAGASEFLQKPLSDEKLKNIWQHVVRKALCGGEIAFPAYVRQVMASKPLSEPLSLAEPARVEPLLSVKIEPKTEELRPTDLFSKEMSDSSDPDRKSDIIGDSFLSVERLAAPATPQLEQMGRIFSKEDALLDESNVSGDPSHVKAELDIPPEEYRICDHFLQVKTEIDDMLDTSSTLCGLFDMKIRDSVLKSDDIESLKSELSTEIPFDDSLDDISLSGDLVIDGDVLSGIDMDPSILDGLNVSESLDISIDCLGDGEIQEAESLNEEALLLAEVEKAEIAGIVRRDYLQNSLQLSTVVAKEARGSSKKSKKRDFEYVASGSNNGQGKRKMKVDWTPDLHRRFVQAVEQLGVDKAIPSRILELMGVQCLTRHNIASHLQKYRSHRKHLLAREAEAANWNNRRNLDAVSWGRTRRDGSSLLPSHHHSNNPPPIQPRPAIGLAPIQPHPLAPPLHVWGHPTVDHSPIHMWQKQPVAAAAWQAADGTFWQQSAACLDAWGHPAPAPGTPCYPPPPMMRLPLAPMPGVANMAVPAIPGGGVSENGDAFGCGKGASFHPLKETVDAAINEVLNNPWIPLPLGLKPPSLESVVAELQRQGITAVPPASS